MEITELLKVRLKKIARFPNDLSDVGTVFCEGSPIYYKTNLSDYPHLFRKMEWWEDRNVEDMPKYLKVTGRCLLDIGSIHKPIRYGEFIEEVKAVLNEDASIYFAIIDGSVFNINISHFEPATESEYLEYLSKTQNT